MKKIALAALILSAVAASAQAQTNVTVYGLMDLGLAKFSDKPVVERENHASRLGFKGAEDLGGGLSAIFQLEMEILADTGTLKGNTFDRHAFVGLKGGFGTVVFGRTKNIVDGAQTRVEPFGADGVIGKVNEPAFRVGVSASRVANAITYNSPNVDGFVGSVQYVLSEVAGASNGVDLLATYDQGPLSLHAGYEQAVQTVAGPAKPTMWVVGGGYKFGDMKLTGAYAKGKTKVLATGEYTAAMIGAIYTVGQGDFKAVFARQQQSNNKFSDKDTVKESGIGYDYHLSKRTDLYAYLGRERVAAVSAMQIGVSHKF